MYFVSTHEQLLHIKCVFYSSFIKNPDIIRPSLGKYYAQQIPNSELTIYPDEGHMVSTTHARETFEELTK
jgi:pimeloyl-ACP methyl ester carboxylesterase